MKPLSFAVAAAALIAGTGAAPAATMTLEADVFDKIEISSGINVVVSIGEIASVLADSPHQEELDQLRFEVRNGRFRAWTDWNVLDLFDFRGDRQIVLTIVVPVLTEIDANSGADVVATGLSGERIVLRASSGTDIDVKGATGTHFDIDSSSGSNLTVEGVCTSAKFVSSSGSNAHAGKLLCVDVEASASSGSNLDVYASGGITAEASSGSDITVHGKPTSTLVMTSSGADITIAE